MMDGSVPSSDEQHLWSAGRFRMAVGSSPTVFVVLATLMLALIGIVIVRTIWRAWWPW